MPISAIDPTTIRDFFPALERIQNGLPVAYFDAPGGTQVPRLVADAMTRYLLEHNANTHWSYPTSVETDLIIRDARQAVADFLGCSATEVAFGHNMTTLTFHLARALGRTWNAGDEVIVTELDHQANVAPWQALERDYGIRTVTARMDPATFQLDYEHLASLINPRTRLLAIGAASNAVGTISDIPRCAALAHDAGALLFVDAVHYAPHELVDVKALGCDALACSSYKFYGPHAGILYVREDLFQSLPFPKLDPSPDTTPERAETGTQNHEAIAAIGATIDFLAAAGGAEGSRRERLQRAFAVFHHDGQRLLDRLWNGLASIDGVRLYGPPPSGRRTPTIALTIDGMEGEAVTLALADRAIFASHGNFYASTVTQVLGVDCLIRLGCAIYTTEEEVDRVIEAVREIAAG